MNKQIVFFILLISIPIIGLFSGCDKKFDESVLDYRQQSDDFDTLVLMEQEIDYLIDTPTCAQASDCRISQFGSKPCGGPSGYKIYSITNVDMTLLQTKIDDYYDFNYYVNHLYGILSDCMVVNVPEELDCVEEECVAVTPYTTITWDTLTQLKYEIFD
ncbi:MAG: hypothetical protein HQ510_04225 [Candidatus Marinimicrobia bacterium]|nr:hypothetical protein [Candidatus Neomarinimicrobiota bacterium]